MNNFLLRIFCLFMAFQVLFASTGFAMNEHFCKIKGAKTYSISIPEKSCCSVRKDVKSASTQTVLKRARCCSDQVAFHKITPNASQGYKIDFQNPSLAHLPTPVCLFTYIQAGETSTENNLLYSNLSPPLSGRDILIRIQSFLI
ncbi:MAG: hypothetical protein U5N85_00790 [Arcicella sp.]|nr:hypothetical protein [Arcicella sp.]